MRWRRSQHEPDGEPAAALPVEIHITRSRTGIDSLDEYLTGRTAIVRERALDSDGHEYLHLDDTELLAYTDQLDFVYLDTRARSHRTRTGRGRPHPRRRP